MFGYRFKDIKYALLLIVVLITIASLSCEAKKPRRHSRHKQQTTSVTVSPTPPVSVDEITIKWDTLMTEAGLVDLMGLGENGLSIDLKYATEDNFAGKNMYGDFSKAYATTETAKSLVDALHLLQSEDSLWGIVIYDAGRPLSVQKIMFDVVKGTPQQKYVASPRGGGPHNYGMALDIGLTYNGEPVDMGTPFDTFDERAHITGEPLLVKQGKISAGAMENRVRLRKAMQASGFRTYYREWWHFTRYSTKYARQHLKLLDF